jgi:hypothetical protein
MRVVEGAQILRLCGIRDANNARLDSEVRLAKSAPLYEVLICSKVSESEATWRNARGTTYVKEMMPLARGAGSAAQAKCASRPFSGCGDNITGKDSGGEDGARAQTVVCSRDANVALARLWQGRIMLTVTMKWKSRLRCCGCAGERARLGCVLDGGRGVLGLEMRTRSWSLLRAEWSWFGGLGDPCNIMRGWRSATRRPGPASPSLIALSIHTASPAKTLTASAVVALHYKVVGCTKWRALMPMRTCSLVPSHGYARALM